MSGPLKERLLYILMASETRFLDRIACQHSLRRLGVVLTVARQAAHVASVVLPALPGKSVTILRMALKARAVSLGCRHLGRAGNVLLLFTFDMLVAVAVAGFA